MNKKYLITFLCAAGIASLAGCGMNTQGGEEQSGTKETFTQDVNVTMVQEEGALSQGGSNIPTEQYSENNVFEEYLRRIYNEADAYRDGFPVKITKGTADNDYYTSATQYREYALADVDGDGENELLLYSLYGDADFITDSEFYKKNDPNYRVFEKIEAYDAVEASVIPESSENTAILKAVDDSGIGEDGQTQENTQERPLSGNKTVRAKNHHLGITASGEGGLSEFTFKDNSVICVPSDNDKLKYRLVGAFEEKNFQDMGFNSTGAGDYVVYWYGEDCNCIKYDLMGYGDGSDGSSIDDEKYKRHMSVADGGNAVGIEVKSFTAPSLGIEDKAGALEERTDEKEQRPEDKVFLEYLRDIYRNSSDIIKEVPVDIRLGEKSYENSWTTYRNYAIDDFDGDGVDELLIHTYGPYTGGMFYDDLNIYNSAYPSYEMYEISSDGKVTDRDTEAYTMHGDVWMLRLEKSEADYSNPSLFTFYNNGVFKFEKTEGGEKKEAYYVYDDSIYEKIKALGHKLFTDKTVYTEMPERVFGEDGYTGSICYLTDANGTIYRFVGSHQDGVKDAVSKQEYDEEINVLTSGDKLGVKFKEFTADNLGTEVRYNSLDEKVINEKETGFFDKYFRVSGEIYRNEGTQATILKLDLPFLLAVTGYNDERALKVNEIQLMDKDGKDLTGLTGHHQVNGRGYFRYNQSHQRDVVLNVDVIE